MHGGMRKTDDNAAGKPAPVRKPDRLAREAEALRANLRRRKDQARQRQEREEPPPPPPAGPLTDP